MGTNGKATEVWEARAKQTGMCRGSTTSCARDEDSHQHDERDVGKERDHGHDTTSRPPRPRICAGLDLGQSPGINKLGTHRARPAGRLTSQLSPCPCLPPAVSVECARSSRPTTTGTGRSRRRTPKHAQESLARPDWGKSTSTGWVELEGACEGPAYSIRQNVC